MHIKEIYVKGLFGMFEHHIPLNQEEHLTVVYGENGIGKTMVFKLVNWLLNLSLDNLIHLQKAPFESLSIIFENDCVLCIANEKTELVITFLTSDEKANKEYRVSKKLASEGKNEYLEKYVDLFLEHSNLEIYSQQSHLLWDSQKNEYLDYEEALLRIGKHLLPEKLIGLGCIFEKDYLSQNVSSYIISTQRLFDYRVNEGYGYGIVTGEQEEKSTQYAKAMSKAITDKKTAYREISDNLKNSLSERILSKSVRMNFSIEELQELSNKVNDKRARLQEVGLIDKSIKPLRIPESLEEIDKAILAVNIQDMDSQLNIYEEEHFYERLKLFIEILNERRLSYKKITVSEKEGFTFTNDNGKVLKPSDLSSGEQHELVLLYQLLFEIPEESLILLDEPEISLHVSWQKEFIDDMKDIIKLRNIDILLATHSPSIINGNWDLTVSLKGKHHAEAH